MILHIKVTCSISGQIRAMLSVDVDRPDTLMAESTREGTFSTIRLRAVLGVSENVVYSQVRPFS